MGLKYAIHRSDTNEPFLRALMVAHGLTVVKIGRPVDLLVAFQGATAVVEVKGEDGTLEASQKSFLAAWPGFSAVVRTEADVVLLSAALKSQANRLRAARTGERQP